MEMDNWRRQKDLIKIFILVLIVILEIAAFGHFAETHFLWNTIIDDVDCTFLTLEKAIEKIDLEKSKDTVSFSFVNGETYEISAKELGIRADEAQIVRIFDYQHQNPKESRKYNLDGFILVNTELLKNFLEEIPELQEKNMVEPQNAYITWDEREYSIQEEVIGNVINFEEAMNLAMEQIKNSENLIDFSPITDVTPEIFAEDLVTERDELNSILNSSINFELSNGNIVTLDSSIIKDWVYQEENGNFAFDIDNGVTKFVEELAGSVNEANSYMTFAATDCKELATVNVPKAVRAQLDTVNQTLEILELLGNPEPITKKPIYDRTLISDMLTSYIEIDLTRQHIWFYLNGELLLDTPCVTGCVRDGNGTPPGVFFLLNKNRGVYLEGYNNDGSKYSSYVEYWMRFNQGIGMHDATWRNKFGGSIYISGGSHGCVNMPKNAAAKTYEYIDETMPIIVYESKV